MCGFAISRESVWEQYHSLWYQHHGGMGYSGPTLSCLRDMTWDQLQFHLRRKKESMDADAAAHAKAAKDAQAKGNRRPKG
ncbi:MAG: hypothetical protein HOW73_43130 [Polyangiaceae bacterium]|nr:hypothetical protein [Polyangiaceae bacterium]